MPIIKGIEALPASIPYDDDPPTVFRDSWGSQLYVKINLDGYVGWGEILVYGSGIVNSYMDVVNDVIKPTILNSSIDSINDIENIVVKLEKLLFTGGLCGVVSGAIGGVEMALWDAYAKYVNKPLMELLGKPIRYEIPIYASFPRYVKTEYIIKAVNKALSRGFTIVKLHEHPSNVPEALKAIREVYGYGIKVAVDINAPFTKPDDAIDFINKIHRYEITWVEEPTWPPNDHDKLKEVVQKSPIPIAAGENEYTVSGFKSLINTGIAYVQPDISKVGGVTKMMDLVKLIGQSGKPAAPHHRPHKSILAHTFTLHIAAVNNAITIVEWPLAPWPQDLINTEITIRNGNVDISTLTRESGVGVIINQEILKSKYHYEGGYKPLIFH